MNTVCTFSSTCVGSPHMAITCQAVWPSDTTWRLQVSPHAGLPVPSMIAMPSVRVAWSPPVSPVPPAPQALQRPCILDPSCCLALLCLVLIPYHTYLHTAMARGCEERESVGALDVPIQHRMASPRHC